MNQTTTEQPMPNLETIKLRQEVTDYRLSNNKEPDTNWWLSKIQERDAMLWQKLEEMKRTDDTQISDDHTYDEALEYAQSLLDVNNLHD